MDVKEALAKLTNALDGFADSDTYKTFLKSQGRFHRYSPRNIALIMFQNPEASHVAGYQRWQSLGRQVRKGEHGLVILAPRTFKDKEKTNKDGTPKTGLYFGLTKVFDISQTDPIEGHPHPFDPTTDILWLAKGETDMLDLLADVVRADGPTVEFAATGGTAVGFFRPADNHIVIGPTNTASMAATLLHEWAHARVHGDGTVYTYQEEEIIVESIAFVCAQVLGITAETETSSFVYITNWLKGDREKFVKALKVVQEESHKMLEAFEAFVLAPE